MLLAVCFLLSAFTKSMMQQNKMRKRAFRKLVAKSKQQKPSSGFTLIELLVVIAIIGVLSTVVVVSVRSALSKARDAKRISDIHQLQVALQMYYNLHGYYPYYNSDGSGNLNLLVTDGLMSVIPKDPANGVPYHYTGLSLGGGYFGNGGQSSKCNAYHLATSLENNNGVLSSDADYSSQDYVIGYPSVLTDAGYRCGSPQNTASAATGNASTSGQYEPAAGGCSGAPLAGQYQWDTGTYCYDVREPQ